MNMRQPKVGRPLVGLRCIFPRKKNKKKNKRLSGFEQYKASAYAFTARRNTGICQQLFACVIFSRNFISLCTTQNLRDLQSKNTRSMWRIMVFSNDVFFVQCSVSEDCCLRSVFCINQNTTLQTLSKRDKNVTWPGVTWHVICQDCS